MGGLAEGKAFGGGSVVGGDQVWGVAVGVGHCNRATVKGKGEETFKGMRSQPAGWLHQQVLTSKMLQDLGWRGRLRQVELWSGSPSEELGRCWFYHFTEGKVRCERSGSLYGSCRGKGIIR